MSRNFLLYFFASPQRKLLYTRSRAYVHYGMEAKSVPDTNRLVVHRSFAQKKAVFFVSFSFFLWYIFSRFLFHPYEGKRACSSFSAGDVDETGEDCFSKGKTSRTDGERGGRGGGWGEPGTRPSPEASGNRKCFDFWLFVTRKQNDIWIMEKCIGRRQFPCLNKMYLTADGHLRVN